MYQAVSIVFAYVITNKMAWLACLLQKQRMLHHTVTYSLQFHWHALLGTRNTLLQPTRVCCNHE